jgi:hypothetical protein
MTHLAHDFWSRRYIVAENAGVHSSWEVVAVTGDGLVAVGNWPGGADSRHATRVFGWADVRAWFADPRAAAAHAERMNAKRSA